MDLPFRGYYINLDRSPARRRRLTARLDSLAIGHAYARVPAAHGREGRPVACPLSDGEVGCFASHVRALAHAGGGGQHAHVLEDDVLVSDAFAPAASYLVREGVLGQFDLLYTDVFVPPDPPTLRRYQQAYAQHLPAGPDAGLPPRGVSVIDLKHQLWASTASYLVAAGSIGRVVALLQAALDAGPQLPVDLVVRAALDRGELRAAVCVPFITSLDLGLDAASTIRAADRSRLACGILRHCFYVRPDWQAVDRLIAAHFPEPAPDRRRRALHRMLDFACLGAFSEF